MAPPIERGRPQRRRGWTPWVIVGVLLLIGGLLTGVLLSRSSGKGSHSQQLAELQQACSQWIISSPAPTAPSDWCSDMVGWMSGRSEGHPGMWASPEAMQATCEQWNAADPIGATKGDAVAWCEGMVSWMQQHAAQWGSWNGWMMHGPMMG